MLSLFHRKTAPHATGASALEAQGGLLLPQSGAALLATPRRQKLLENIWQRTSVARTQFALLYLAPFERYAALVQQLPASEAHHHAYLGGMLDHGLEIVAYALKLRQSHLLPAGAPPEAQAAQAEAWTAAIAYAALLHDIGKIAVDLHVEYADGERWYPWHGPLQHPYRFRYRRDRVYRLHGAAAGLLYAGILDRPILDWLSGFAELWACLLYELAGQHEHAGVLGELVMQADQASVAQELGGDPSKARSAPKHALQRKLLEGLRYLIREKLKLNQPQASDGWLTQDALWLVPKTVCDQLRAHLLSQGIEEIPDQNTAIFNELQDHGIAQPNAEGKAIWRATVASSTGWTQSFSFLRVAPALIWETGDWPAAFSGTVRIEESTEPSVALPKAMPVIHSSEIDSRTLDKDMKWETPSVPEDAVSSALALLDEVTSASAQPESGDISEERASTSMPTSPDPILREVAGPSDGTARRDGPPGAQFITWLHDSIESRRLIINDAKALVHTVAGTAFLVTPGIFQRYAQLHPEIGRFARQVNMADWEWIQKNFEKLRMHRKQDNGLNIWMCEVVGPRKSRRLHGYLLIDGGTIFSDVPPDNPYLKVS